MTAPMESDVFNDCNLTAERPLRQFGMVPLDRLAEFELPNELDERFQQYQQLGPIEELTEGPCVYVLRNYDENGNDIFSVVRYEKAARKLHATSRINMEAFSILRCNDGVLRGEKHLAKRLRMTSGISSSRLAEYQDTVAPLTRNDIDLIDTVVRQVTARKNMSRFVINQNIA